jgi:hypothetical protein
MKHAGAATLDALEDVLVALRARGCKETHRGVFYRNGRAWLHFHEDPAGLFADVRFGDEWERLRVSEPHERDALLTFVDEHR